MQYLEEVKKLMAQLEKIKLDEAMAKAESIKDTALKEIEEIKESVKPKVKKAAEETKDTISEG